MCELYTSYADTLSNVAVNVHDNAGCTYHCMLQFNMQLLMQIPWLQCNQKDSLVAVQSERQ